MSDFDKEAEREKLREKYERDQAERQATQRMSDLLLKGATMTNAHCGTCGDPLFQENGTTFCPSCHGNPDAVEGTDLEAQSAEEAAAESGGQSGGQPAPGEAAGESAGQPTEKRTDRGADRTPSSADTAPEATESATPDADASESNRQQRRREGTPTGNQTVDSGAGADPRTSGEATPDSPSTSDRRTVDHSTGSAAPSGNADLETARDSLVAALEKFAGKAAATDDPRYAKECLEAAREASETLETLR